MAISQSISRQRFEMRRRSIHAAHSVKRVADVNSQQKSPNAQLGNNVVLARHTRVWPTAAGYAALASESCDATALAAIDLWCLHRWPLVVRRWESDELRCGDTIAVGLALPPSFGKQRIKLRLMRRHIAAHAEPLGLDEVVKFSSRSLQNALVPLASAAARGRIMIRVFGSAAWETQTGLGYMHADSDLDVLVAPRSTVELRSAMTLLDRAQRHIAMRLDGEIVFTDGDAVAWRGWAQGTNRVLVKNIDRAALMARDDLLDRLNAGKLAA
jgi:phosphoribosyl-dephospho-CoA transferase